MDEFLLGLRLIRGGGRSGWLRLALMASGLAFGVVVVLVVVSMPSVLAERGRVVSVRAPLGVVDGTGQTFDARAIYGVWNGERLTRVLVANVSGAPLPPGVTQLPGPGETVLSPGAVALAERDSGFSSLVPGTMIGMIGEAGLVGPDEVYAYVGVSAESASLAPSRGWGGSGFDATVSEQYSAIPWQLALVVAGPLAVYLVVCMRLSALTRRRRTAALRLLGVDRKRLGRIAGAESGVVGGVGALLGVLAYEAVNRELGPSGIMGFTWFPAISRSSWQLAFAVVVLVAAGSAAGGALATWRTVADPVRARFDPADRPVRWWAAVPFVLGTVIMVGLLLPGDRPTGASDRFGATMVFSVVLAAVGLIPAVRQVALAVARRVALAGPTLAARIAARRIEASSGGIVTHVSGLCLLVLVAGIGSAVLEAGARGSTPANDQVVVHINGNEMPPSALAAMTDLPAASRWVVQDSVTEPPSPTDSRTPTTEDLIRVLGVKRVFIDCQSLAAQTQTALPDCQEGQDYQIDYGDLPGRPILEAGRVISYENGDVSVPDAVMRVRTSGPLPPGLVIVTTTDARQVGPWPESVTFFYHLSPEARSLDGFASSLARVAPSAVINVFNLNLDRLEQYRAESGTVGSAVAMAFALAVAAFLVSSMAAAQARRADNVSLAVLGMRRRSLRAAQRYQLLLPLAVALPMAAATGWLAGNTLLMAGSPEHGWYFGSAAFIAILCAVALTAAWIAGGLFAGARPRAEELRRE